MIESYLFEAAIAGVIVVSNVVLGVSVNSSKQVVAALGKQFAEFSDKCRVRHDEVATKDDIDRLDKVCEGRHTREKEAIERTEKLFMQAVNVNTKKIDEIEVKLAYANGVQHK